VDGVGLGNDRVVMGADKKWSKVETEILERRKGGMGLDEQLTCLRRLYDVPEGVEARERRRKGKGGMRLLRWLLWLWRSFRG